MDWYLKVFRQYADFTGRARRKEYWMFQLFNWIFFIIAFAIDYMIMTKGGFPIINILFTLVILLPSLAVTVRRLHDVGKSGWMILISLIPIIGGIWLFVLLVTNGEPGENIYGINPKGTGIDFNFGNNVNM